MQGHILALGTTYLKLGMDKEAIKAFKQAIKLKPDLEHFEPDFKTRRKK